MKIFEGKRKTRTFYDQNGKPIRWVHLPFEEIQEDYNIKSIRLKKFKDVSYLGAIKKLSLTSKDFNNLYNNTKEGFAVDILSRLALDYLKSAIKLQDAIKNERNFEDIIVVSFYVIPCIFCCRHAVELKLKQVLFEKNKERNPNHTIYELWQKLVEETKSDRIKKLDPFIKDIDKMDKNEIVMRYGLNKNYELLKEDYLIDIDALIDNTKYLFNSMAIDFSCF